MTASDEEFFAKSAEVMRKYGVEINPDAEAAEPAPEREYDPSLIPDASFCNEGRVYNPALTELKERVDRDVSIFDAYDYFMPADKKANTARFAKNRPEQREGIKFSCPSPDHYDEHPSMWANIDGLWYCGTCGAKGDIYTLVAMQLGLDYRSDFKDVLIAIADAFNIEYIKSPVTGRILQQPSTAPRVTIVGEDVKMDPPPAPRPPKTLDWRYLFPKDTFARNWMEIVQVDDLPEEYYAMLALMAVGLAIGRDAYTPDEPNVHGNLFLVLFGPTGSGKSRSIRLTQKLLTEALPYDGRTERPKGVRRLMMPGSPEALIDLLSKPIPKEEDQDDSSPPKYAPIRAFLAVDEFATLSGSRDSTRGLKLLLQQLWDCTDKIETSSRGHGDVTAEEPYLALASTTQPTAVRTAINYADVVSGYINRFIFVLGTTKKRYPLERPPMPIKDVAADLANIRAWASQRRIVNVDTEARALWEKFYAERYETINADEEPILARIDIMLRKLMLLLACNERSEVITVEHVQRAIHLFEYLSWCYRFVAENIVSSVSNDLSDWLSDLCRTFPEKHGKLGPSLRDLKRHLPKRFDEKQLLDAIRSAEILGVITPHKQVDGAGRPTLRYVYVHDA